MNVQQLIESKMADCQQNIISKFLRKNFHSRLKETISHLHSWAQHISARSRANSMEENDIQMCKKALKFKLLKAKEVFKKANAVDQKYCLQEKRKLRIFQIFIRTYINLKAEMKKKLIKKGEAPNQEQTELYHKITTLETEIEGSIQKLKVNTKRSYVCEHSSLPTEQCQPFDSNVNYFDKFWKRFLLNEVNKQNLEQFRKELKIFGKGLTKIETRFQQWEKIVEPVKRVRRRIQKQEGNERFSCHICSKKYIDEQTLMIHIKCKHRTAENIIQQRKESSDNRLFEEDEGGSQ